MGALQVSPDLWTWLVAQEGLLVQLHGSHEGAWGLPGKSPSAIHYIHPGHQGYAIMVVMLDR